MHGQKSALAAGWRGITGSQEVQADQPGATAGIRVRVGESLNQGSGPGDGRGIQEAGLPSDFIGGVWEGLLRVWLR